MAGKKRTPGRPRKKVAPPLAGVNPAAPGHASPETGAPFTIVGIGASAGGLDALSRFLREIPDDTGMAFVIVQHLDPTHVSSLPDLLARQSPMPVCAVQDHMAVKPDQVYVIPPGKDMVLKQGTLQLAPRVPPRGQHRGIDHFFRSLAEEQGHKAIGVVLSGNANDGTQGLDEIKGGGGITFAQDDSAEYASMPRSAIAAGCADFVLPPDGIAREIGRISRHPAVAHGAGPAPDAARADPALGRILELLRRGTGVDFSSYKRNTLSRRITRRLVLSKLETLGAYADFLQANPPEVSALYRDILISVTSFFRDPDAFEAIKASALPRLTQDPARQEPLRIWALGCSTGEEAYSIAMLINEYADATGRQIPFQVFATDLSGEGIARARAGLYARGIAQDVSPERLRRFFVEVDGQYRISKSIRDQCVFARHNVLADPPFSRMDLIACRNMLIYLEPALQQRVMPMLHYALQPGGFLWLGCSETIGSFRHLFELQDPKAKLYTRKAGRGSRVFADNAQSLPAPVPAMPARPGDSQREADRILLSRYAPAAVVLNEDLDIVQFRGDTSPWLMPAPGRASLNFLKMLREGLMMPVRAAVQKALREKSAARADGLRVKSDGGFRTVNVVALPMKGGDALNSRLLVLFEEPDDVPQARAARRPRDGATRPGDEAAEFERMKLELDSTRDYLQSVIEQQESANEELQSANEEVQSANEELQSINEELETSKEEIQSSNEELATVNDELQTRNNELSLINNDLTNLLASVNIAIVMLDRDLRVRRFTPVAERIFNLIPADAGRPIRDLKLRVAIPDFDVLLAGCIESAQTRDLEVQDDHGAWYSLRMRPYRTLDGHIEGVVVLLWNIDALKQAESTLVDADRGKNEFLALLAHELRNPLAALQGAVDFRGVQASAETLEQARQVALRQVHGMTRMVDDLLDVSRLGRGTMRLELATVDLLEVIRDAVGATDAARKQMRQSVSLALPQHPLMIHADKTRIQQVLANLLHNATKFTPAGGAVWISVEERRRPGLADGARSVSIRIIDNGVGIEPAAIEHLFELFHRSHDPVHRPHAGLGIGLALSRQLVELHGGALTCTSQGRGRGSEFTVTLPVAAPDERPAPPPSPAPDATIAAGALRILVVDDNRDAADMLSLLLQADGHQVRVARSGRDGIERLAESIPDLVLLDIGLPDLSGYEVAKQMRAMPGTQDMFLVALTGYDGDSSRRQSVAAGFDQHLLKPVQHDTLRQLIARCGGRRPH